jgi:hypothetical protein
MRAKNWVCLLSTISSALGCADGNACDPDMVRDRNYCLYASPAGSDGGMGGMGGEAPEPPGPPTATEPSAVFGSICTLENEAEVCSGDAPNCGLAPGADEGICTVFGCESTPEVVVCPIGWYCFGLADACLEE